MTMISFTNTIKKYKGETVLVDCSLSISPALVTALVAPNGHGKSTLIKLLINALYADSGIIDKPSNLRASYLPENVDFPESFTVKNVLYQEALLQGLTLNEMWEQPAVKVFKLESFQQKKCKQLSKGMKQKLAIAKSMLSDPDFLILDEPFNSLDTIGRDQLIGLLKKRKSQNKGTLLSSHILFSMDSFCDVVCFFGGKKLLFQIDIRDESHTLIKVNNDYEDAEQLRSKSVYHDNNHYLIPDKFFRELNLSGGTATILENSNSMIDDIYKIVYAEAQ